MNIFEEINPPNTCLDQVYSTIRHHLPSTANHDIRFLYHGTMNVFEVATIKDNLSTYIFRFPDRTLRNATGLMLIQRETQILEFLRPHFSLNLPNPQFISTDPAHPYVGYRKIPGVSLAKVYSTATSHERQKIAQQIGRFLKKLHAPALYREYRSLYPAVHDKSPEHIRAELFELFSKVKDRVFPILNTNQQQWLTELFIRFLNNRDNFKFNMTLIHGDFDASNILVDPKTAQVTGIIDFEETSCNDPAIDLLFFREGFDFLNEVLTAYGADKNRVWERMLFYFSKACVHYLLFGIQFQRSRLIEEGRNMLNRRQQLLKKVR